MAAPLSPSTLLSVVPQPTDSRLSEIRFGVTNREHIIKGIFGVITADPSATWCVVVCRHFIRHALHYNVYIRYKCMFQRTRQLWEHRDKLSRVDHFI